MWRFWNCVPRFVRQQCHGPRASSGVCAEEEKADHEADKHVGKESAQEPLGASDRKADLHGCRVRQHRSHCSSRFWTQGNQGFQETDSKKETHHNQSDQWKADHRLQFWGPRRHFDQSDQRKADHHSQFWPFSSGEQSDPWKADNHAGFWLPFWRRGEVAKSALSEGVQEPPDTAGQDPHDGRHCRFQQVHTQEADGAVKESGGDAGRGGEHGGVWCEGRGQERGGGGASHYGDRQGWKERCRQNSWTHMWSQQHSLEAVTWGAGMVFGLQLSRKPQFQNFVEAWQGGAKWGQWWGLLRVAFSKPPDGAGHSVVPGRCLPQKQDADTEAGASAEQPLQVVPQTVVSDSEDQKTLSDVMRDFEASCQQYTAVSGSVSGLMAAEQGESTAAVEHLRQAAQLGHAPACFNLALCYDRGLGVKRDLKQAAVHYQRAADQGHAQSLFNLALMTLRGDGGLTKDQTRALQLLTRAAKQGLAQAQTYLGVYYTENDDSQHDWEQAASFFRAAATQNDAEGQYFLGVCYENGWGVESSDQEAATLYAAAAQQGHDGALYNMAAFHQYGLGGVERDEDRALTLYQQAAQHGNHSAKLRLDEHEARTAVSMWADQNSETEAEPSPGLRRSAQRSSSPVLSDLVRESVAGLWSGELSAWFSSQSLTFTSSSSSSSSSSRQRATFTLGEGDSDCSPRDAEVDCPQQGGVSVSVGRGCLSSLHRPATMPELRMVSCQ